MSHVGFSFQGDVFQGGSLAFSAAGRIMKLLSDGGVDTYALGVILALGRKLHISQRQEAMVSGYVASRSSSRQGILARALAVGWGHCDAAVELSKTRGGCASLLLIDCLAAGIPHFATALALQELLSLNGLQDGLLPTVDALSTVIRYLLPTMKDSTFHSVLETVTTTSVSGLSSFLSHSGFEVGKVALVTNVGEPQSWASMAHQLNLTSSLDEHIYIHADSRAAWIASYAVHFLEMKCSIAYNTRILWAAAGTRGSVMIQTAPKPSVDSSLYNRALEFINERHSRRWLPSSKELRATCLLCNALQTALSRTSGHEMIPTESVMVSIVSILCTLAVVVRVRFGRYRAANRYPITGYFTGLADNIVAVCRSLGISFEGLETLADNQLNSARTHSLYKRVDWKERRYFDMDAQLQMMANCSCEVHRRRPSLGLLPCILGQVDDIINGFSATALALLTCDYDSSTLRVDLKKIVPLRSTDWSDFVWNSLDGKDCGIYFPRLMYHLCDIISGVEESMLDVKRMHVNAAHTSVDVDWEHRLVTLAGSSAMADVEHRIIAASGSSATVALRALFDDEAFDKQGKFIAIYPGRISLHGNIRRTVVDGLERYLDEDDTLLQTSTLAVGTTFELPEASLYPNLRLNSAVKILDNKFEVQLFLSAMARDLARIEEIDNTCSAKPIAAFGYTHTIERLLQSELGKPCQHDTNARLLVPTDRTFRDITFGVIAGYALPKSCTFISASGKSFQQLISIYLTFEASRFLYASNTRPCIVVKGQDQCVNCAYQAVKKVYSGPTTLYDRAYQAVKKIYSVSDAQYDGAIVIC